MVTRVYKWHEGCFINDMSIDYAILEVNGEVYCHYEGAGALTVAREDAAHYAGGVARLATTDEIATWPR